MKPVIRAVFRPVANRYYAGKKASAVMYVSQLFPTVLICIYAALSVNPLFWAALGIIVAGGFIDYVLFDAFLDKLGWQLVWRHFYGQEVRSRTKEQDVMKAFEQNPTSENYETLAKRLKGRN